MTKPFSYEDAVAPAAPASAGFSYEDATGEPKKPEKGPGLARGAADTAIAGATGLVSGVQMLSNVAGADNPVSRRLGKANEFLTDLESPYRKAEKQERAKKIKAAEESGSTWEEVKAYGGAFAEAPLDTTVNALGTSVPTLAAAFLTGGASVPAQVAARALPKVIGVAQGTGAVKGQIYEAVEQEHLKAGKTPEEAAALAAKAQAYDGKNAGQIALGGVFGGVAAGIGAEAAIRRFVGGKVAGEAGKEAAMGIGKAAGLGVLKETPVEMLQGGQERVASNLALQNEGFDTPTWRGVGGQAFLDGLASAPMGAGFGMLDARGGPTVNPNTAAEPPAQPQAPAEQPPATFVNPDAPVSAEPPPVVTPSQAMGIDPNAGAISRVAAAAVDGPASMEMAAQQAEAAIAAEDNPEAGAPADQPIPLEDRPTDELRMALRNAQDPAIRKTIGEELQRRREAPASPDLFAPDQGAANVSNTDAAGAVAAGVGGAVGADAAGSRPDAGLLEADAGQRPAGTAGAPAPSVQESDAAPVPGRDSDKALTKGPTNTKAKVKGLKDVIARNKAAKANVQDQPQAAAPAAAPTPANPEVQQAAPPVGSDGAAQPGAAPAGSAGVEADGVIAPALAKREDGSLKNKSEYTADEWSAYTKSVIDAKLGAPAPTPSPTTTEPTNAPRSPEAAQAVETKTEGREETALLSDSVSTEPNLEAAKALLTRQKAATGNAVAEGKVRKELRDLAAKTPETDTKTMLALDTAATRLGMGEGRLKGLEFKQPDAPAAPAVAAPAPDKDARENLTSTSQRERDLRALSHEKEQPGDVMLGNDRFVTLEQAKAAAQAAIDEGVLRADAPFQYNRILDIAPRDWQRMVLEMTGKPYDIARPSDAPAPSQQAQAPAEPQETTHNGTRIYRTRTKLGDQVKTMWAVETPENKARRAAGERALGGDTLHDTIEQAKAAADREAKQYADRKAFAEQQDAEERARKEADEARKASNRGKSIAERRKETVLDGQTKLPASAGLGNTTRRNAMQMAVEQGRAVVERQVDDTAAKKRDQDAIDRVRSAGYMLGLSNENIPVVKAGLEAQARLKANDYKKPEYRVYAGSEPTGGFFEITKIEYEYAQELMAEKAAKPAAAPAVQPTVDQAANEAATSPSNDLPEPTQAQKEAGNYKKGHVQFDGLDLTVENPVGSTRSGTDPSGKPWEVTMTAHYGYHKRTTGADGDQVDVYLADNPVAGSPVFVFDQFNADGSFDEHKAVAGVATEVEAIAIYDAHFSDGSGPKRRRTIKAMTPAEFKAWAMSDAAKQPLASEVIPAPDGGLDYGEITPEMGKVMRRQAGKIRLTRGVQNSNGTGHGLVHIEANHGKDIRALGFTSIEEFVAYVAGGIQQVWQVPGNSQLLVTTKDGRKDVMYIRLEVAKEGDFYRVNSAFPVRQQDYEALHGMKKIWDGSEPTSAVTGQRPAFATAAIAAPDSESSQGSSNARGQADSVAQPIPEAQAETPKLTQAEAKDLMEWQDLGQKDGIKTHILTFYESKANKDAKRGRMVVATVTKGDRSATAWMVDGDDKTFGPLALAKKHGMEVGMARAVADGFVEPAAAAPEAPKKGLAGARAKKAAEELGIREVPVVDKRPAAPAGAEQELGAQATGAVENFGEKLPPARRTMAAKLSEDLTDDKIASLPLSQIWPAAENEAIEDVPTAAVAHVMREAIPAKPRVAYKVKSWVEKVKFLRDFAAKVVRGDISRDRLMEEMQKVYALRDLAAKIKLLEQIDRAQWKRIGDVSEAPNAVRYEEGKAVPSPSSSVNIDGRSHWLRGSGNVLDHIEGIKAMLGDGAPEAKMQFEIRQEGRGERKVFISKKGDKEYRRLMEFATVDEARKALKEQYADLVDAWEGVKGRDNITERDLRSDTNRDRTGKDHRKGRDVTAEEFESKFGFRGGEFGKWVGQGKGAQERQFMLNSAYDALMDLSDLLGIPPKAISLEGSLGIAFGSRGSGWASAHFEPSNLVINLTKTRGAGALAHEWFHALDNYFARKRNGGEVPIRAGSDAQSEYRRNNYITHKTSPMMVRKDGRGSPVTKERLAEWRKSSADSAYLAPENWMEDPNHKQGVRAEVEQAFADLVKTLNDTPMLKRARRLDGVKDAEGYWSRMLEMAARSFENYVQTRMMEQGYHNDFLANVKEAPEVGKNVERYPYLLPSEIAPVADAFKVLFDTIQTKEDDAGNVAMFSQGLLAPASLGPKPTADQIQRLLDKVQQVAKNALPVTVTASPSDIPGLKVPAGAKPTGALIGGRVYLFADNLKSSGDAYVTLFHELFHLGLQKVIPAEDYAAMLAKFSKNLLVQRFVREWKASPEGVEKAGTMPAAAYDALAAEEALAMVSEELAANNGIGTNGAPGLVKAMLSWLSTVADRLGLPSSFSDWMRGLTRTDAEKFVSDMVRAAMGGEKNLGRTRTRYGTELAQMTEQTRLSAGAAAQTDTPAFKRWFGDSKVVDADGKPLVVYHGTSRDFDTFRDGDGAAGKGIYFSPDARIAGNYAAVNGSAGARVLPVYLSIANPFMLKETDTVPSRKVLERRGYDGVIYTHSWNDGTVATEYIAFRPEQVKSAIGNNGQFDAGNPDIRFRSTPRELAGMATDQLNTALKSVTITSIKQAAGYKATDLMGIALGGLGRRQLVEIYGKDLPLDKYNELATQMEADKNEYGAEADTIATEWGKLKDEGALANIMHDATLAKIDPDKPLQPGDDPAAYNALKMRFGLMSKEAKETYRKARDGYKRHHANVREAIKERIERSQMSPERRAALVERMDSEFFAAMKGVYFPLARFGKYVVVVRGADGKVETVARSETMAEAAALRRNLVAGFPAAKGYQVDKVILSREFVASRDAVGRGFMQELYQVLDKQDMDPAMRAEMEDTLGQLYLSSLPDVSWAKHGIHRKGTPGFSQDARRAFAQNMFHGARYLAKLRYSDLMQNELKAMQDHVDNIGNVLPDEDGFNGPRMQRVVDEFYKRHDSLMNPNSHPWSTALTSIGFMFHLGLSPASALVNLTQTAFVAYPLMAAKWGFGKAGVALLKASKQAAMGKNDITKFLNRDERRAYDQAVKDGTIDVTQAHDLVGIAQGEDAGVMWRIRPAMRAASFLFHHAERFNRQATFVAAYRLAREAGENHETAFAQATKATYDGHYDYSAGNRPRFMQGNAAKVILLFKQYAQNMVYTLARNAYQSVNGLDPKERAEARKALAGILATHAMAAGVLGLPMVTTILAAISAAGSDDDEPFDAQVALQNMLADTFGQKPAEVITRGLSRLTPWDISGRVGLDRLIFPDVQEGLEGQRLAESAAFAALGPVAGIFANFLKGVQEISEGHMLRGITTMMPAALRGPLNAVRLSNEGAQDKTGITIVDEVDAASVFGQALGFSPSVVRQATEGKRAVLSYDRALNERRQELMTQYARGAMKQDAEAMQEAREAIQAFNEKNPGRRITMMQLNQSVRNRERRISQADDGVYLPKNRREAMDQGRFALSE